MGEGILTQNRGVDKLYNESLERIRNLMTTLNKPIITISFLPG